MQPNNQGTGNNSAGGATPPAAPAPTTPPMTVSTPTTAQPANMTQPAQQLVQNVTAANAAQPANQAASAKAGKDSKEVKPTNPNSTQNSLLISEVRDDMVVMNDGSFRAVVACQSINFDLMSSTEQESIEVFFQGFLNSLYFPMQIFIRSQRVDMEPYLKYLSDLQAKEDNMLLRTLMDDYTRFIDRLAAEANIMKKAFFVVVEFSPFGDLDSQANSTKNLFSNLFGSEKTRTVKVSGAGFTKAKDEINNRVNTVINGLNQVGVNAARVNTRDLATIFYNIYNPDTAVNEPLVDFRKFTHLYTSKAPAPAATATTNQQGGQNG